MCLFAKLVAKFWLAPKKIHDKFLFPRPKSSIQACNFISLDLRIISLDLRIISLDLRIISLDLRIISLDLRIISLDLRIISYKLGFTDYKLGFRDYKLGFRDYKLGFKVCKPAFKVQYFSLGRLDRTILNHQFLHARLETFWPWLFSNKPLGCLKHSQSI